MADWVPCRSVLSVCFPGCVLSSREAEQRRRSREIDERLSREQEPAKWLMTVLLLGAGGSGKATFLRQLRVIYRQGFARRARQEFRASIYCSVLEGMRLLLEAREKLRIPWGDRGNQLHGDALMAFDPRGAAQGTVDTVDARVFAQYLPALRALWADGGVRNAYGRRREFQLGESVKYFLDSLDRLGQADYIPSLRDVLLARRPLRTICEYDFEFEHTRFRIIHIGGLRPERKRWFQCLGSVRSVLFFVSSNEFDQVLTEDPLTNRLIESLNSFEIIANNRAFCDVCLIVLFNKTDLLEEKVRTVSIKDSFPEFEGDPHCLTDVQGFLMECFRSIPRHQRQDLYLHFMSAIDTEDIRRLFPAFRDGIVFRNCTLRDIIFRDNIKELMPH